MQAERGGTYNSIDVPGSMLTEVDGISDAGDRSELIGR